MSILIICEGKTEQNYFTGMRTRYGPQLDVDAPDGSHVAAVRAASERAATAVRSGEPYDAVWCVLDTELDPLLVDSVREEADNGDVEVAFSCPSFELWLILHKEPCARPFQSAEEAKRMLRQLYPRWNESGTRYSDFEPGLVKAIENARALDPTGKNHMMNPSSSVWRLVDDIRRDPGTAQS